MARKATVQCFWFSYVICRGNQRTRCSARSEKCGTMFRSGWTIFCGCAVLIAVLAWILITNPIAKTSGPMATEKVSPLRLERHVRMLAETFFPRDAYHS